MGQFVVPQFIDVESKIFGPITVRQFVISLFGGLFVVIAYKSFDTGLFIISFLLIAVAVFAFGFLKVNGRPFHKFLTSFFTAISRPGVRVWKPGIYEKHDSASKIEDYKRIERQEDSIDEGLTKSRLQELTLIVDTGGMYKAEDDK